MKALWDALTRNRLGMIPYRGWEWLFMRVAFSAVVIDSGLQLSKSNQKYDTMRSPHGLAQFMDVSFLQEGFWLGALPWIYGVLAILYVAQVAPVLTIGTWLFFQVTLGTFYMSQGAMHHAHQIIPLILLGQWIAALWYAGRERSVGSVLWPGSPDLTGKMVYFSQQMMVMAYVTTGLTKIIRSDGYWIKEIPNLAVQFEKSVLMEYYNTLEPSNDRVTEWMTRFLEELPNLARVGFSGVLLLELLAFFALWNRSVMALWGLALVAMHLGIGLVMKLDFEYHEWACLIFFVNVPFWVFTVAKRRMGSPPAAPHAA